MSPVLHTLQSASPHAQVRLRSAASALEAQFLSEMLKATRVAEPRESFGGGAGEAQFASFMRDAYAEKLAEAGGIGLADRIVAAMEERGDV
ncbi:rod-binding protein [Roseivivax halodurans]|nr:rod-binding protein [Roseivivax halodurans]